MVCVVKFICPFSIFGLWSARINLYGVLLGCGTEGKVVVTGGRGVNPPALRVVRNGPCGCAFSRMTGYVKRRQTGSLFGALCGGNMDPGGRAVAVGSVCMKKSAAGCTFRLRSNCYVRAMYVGEEANGAMYIDAVINYPIKYVFYTSKGGKFVHGLSPTRVIRRVILLGRHIGEVIFVKVKRPLFGCSGLVGDVRVLHSHGKLGFPASNVGMSAIKPIRRLGQLERRRLGVRFALSLRTASRTAEGVVVPRVGSGDVRDIIRTTLSCSRQRGEGVAVTCLLTPKVGSETSSMERLNG